VLEGVSWAAGEWWFRTQIEDGTGPQEVTMRIRAILPLIVLLVVACLSPAAIPNTQAPPTSGQGQATLIGHTDFVLSVAWSPDGKQLASGSADRTIIVWDVASAKS
jgi:WD40 repeat protein